MSQVAIVGASGYTGGELLRLLVQHPGAEVTVATSGQFAGKPLHHAHPNLRGSTDLTFAPRDAALDADVVFTCTPHGQAIPIIEQAMESGAAVIDLSADLRLPNAAAYEHWYGAAHPRPDLLEEATYGLPEANREAIRSSRFVSGVGCMATAMNLALLPLSRAGLLDGATVIADTKIGSSAAGVEANPSTSHPNRSRSLRLYAPTSHRHAAEVELITGVRPEVSAHSVELVRGILATCHVLPQPGTEFDEKALWRAYRASYQNEPFVRVVKERTGVHRGPDPKLVAGSNFVDVGFHASESRIVATSALDNLVKGAAGTAVQCYNLMTNQNETTGLNQLPVFPQ